MSLSGTYMDVDHIEDTGYTKYGVQTRVGVGIQYQYEQEHGAIVY